jgi:hypothetical protein
MRPGPWPRPLTRLHPHVVSDAGGDTTTPSVTRRTADEREHGRGRLLGRSGSEDRAQHKQAVGETDCLGRKLRVRRRQAARRLELFGQYRKEHGHVLRRRCMRHYVPRPTPAAVAQDRPYVSKHTHACAHATRPPGAPRSATSAASVGWVGGVTGLPRAAVMAALPRIPCDHAASARVRACASANGCSALSHAGGGGTAAAVDDGGPPAAAVVDSALPIPFAVFAYRFPHPRGVARACACVPAPWSVPAGSSAGHERRTSANGLDTWCCCSGPFCCRATRAP